MSLHAQLEAKRRRLEEEAKKKGNLSVTQIQGILQNAPKSDEVDWVQEIQELKQQLTMEVRALLLLSTFVRVGNVC